MAISDVDRDNLRFCFRLAASESHDPTRAVGSMIVKGNRPIGVGTNRPPARLTYSRLESGREIASDPNWKYYIIEHAEREAINDARDKGQSAIGATMYTTLFPCADCTRAIIAAGIVRLVAPYGTPAVAADSKWIQHFEYSRRMLHRAHVDLQTYSMLELGAL